MGFDGVQNNIEQISHKTHISIENLNYLFNKEFDKLNKIKVNSFITIIQRETQLDLSELKEEADDYFAQTKKAPSILAAEYKQKTENQKKKQYFLTITLTFIVFIIALLLFTYFRPVSNIEDNQDTEVTTNEMLIVPIEKEKEIKEEIKESQEVPLTQEKPTQNDDQNSLKAEKTVNEENIAEVQQAEKVQQVDENTEVVIPKSIKVTSKYKVWVGIQYLDDLKTEETTANEIILDPNRDFVATFGHNVVQIITQDSIYDYKNDPNKRRISYIDGKVEIITKKKLESLVREYKANR